MSGTINVRQFDKIVRHIRRTPLWQSKLSRSTTSASHYLLNVCFINKITNTYCKIVNGNIKIFFTFNIILVPILAIINVICNAINSIILIIYSVVEIHSFYVHTVRLVARSTLRLLTFTFVINRQTILI